MSTERSRSSRSATKVTAHDDELMTTLASIKADTKATSENLEALNVKFDTSVENSKIGTLSMKREPWFTTGLLTSSRTKAKLFTKKLKNSTNENIQKYKT